jgi:hypothetical protein
MCRHRFGFAEAKRFVRVLVENGCQPGVDIDTRLAVSWLIEDGMDENDCLLGLAQAGARAWVVSRQTRTIALTLAGFAAGKDLN